MLEEALEKTKRLLTIFIGYIATLASKFITLTREQIGKDGSQRYTFAIFAMLNYVAPMFIINMVMTLTDSLILLRVIAVALCFGLCTVDYWMPTIRDLYYPLYWYITLWFCLPFLSSYTAFITRGEECWILNSALSMLLLMMLVSWVVFIILMTSGLTASYIIYSIKMSDMPPIHLPSNDIYPFAYLCAFLLLSVVLFMRHKEDVQGERIEMLQLFGGAIAHEVNSPLAAIRMLTTTFSDIAREMSRKAELSYNEEGEEYYSIKIDQFDYKMLLETLPQSFIKTSLEASKVVEILLFSLKDKISTPDKVCNISDIIEEAMEGYGLTPEQRTRIAYDTSNDFTFLGSRQLCKHVLYNLMRNTFKYGGEKARISIWLDNHCLYFRDSGVGIPPDEIDKIFKSFYTNSKTGTGIGLAFCNSVMKSIGGSIECQSEYGSYSKFILKFPMDRWQNSNNQ